MEYIGGNLLPEEKKIQLEKEVQAKSESIFCKMEGECSDGISDAPLTALGEDPLEELLEAEYYGIDMLGEPKTRMLQWCQAKNELAYTGHDKHNKQTFLVRIETKNAGGYLTREKLIKIDDHLASIQKILHGSKEE